MKSNASAKRRLIRLCALRGVTLGCAESCTGGLCAKLLTDVPGASAAFWGGFVTYTNEQKMQLLSVDPDIINQYTEVSEPCARAMAEGAKAALGVDYALSTTGYAGPGGGTERDPAGTVYIAVAGPCGTVCERFFAPDATRPAVRRLAAQHALEMVLEMVERDTPQS